MSDIGSFTSFSSVPTTSQSTTVASIHQFTVDDWDVALPLMQAISDQAAGTQGASHFDWTRADDQALFRSSFENADSLISFYDAASCKCPFLGALLPESVAKQERFQVSGPPQELQTIKDRTQSLDADYYESAEGFQTGFISQTGADQSGIASGEGTLCTSHPTFTVSDWTAAAPLVREFIDCTALEEGCTYFGWSSKGECLSWHGNYVNGAALRSHFENVRPLIAALNAGPAKLVRLELHGPAIELDKARGATGGIDNVLRYESDNRVKRLTKCFERTSTPVEKAS
jgi:hypothetical protein